MSSNPLSILDSVKKVLGLDAEYTDFDLDVTMHINNALGVLKQLGAGPTNGLFIADNTTSWTEFTSIDSLLNLVKSYIYVYVQLMFDPPPTSFAIASKEQMVKELTWRINVEAENTVAVVPTVPVKWWDVTGLTDFPGGAVTGDYGYDTSTWNIYVMNQVVNQAYWWDLTGLDDFPAGAVVGDIGFNRTTGEVWSMS